MSTSQKHGVQFEETTFVSNKFPGAEVLIGKRNLLHDIPAEYDPRLGINTSVKVKKRSASTICLADAVRFFTTTKGESIRLVIGLHEQLEDVKVVPEIVEVVIDKKHFAALWGEVSLEELYGAKRKIHDVPIGDHEAGRPKAQKWLAPLRKKRGLVTLNPKVGSGDVRRLQCSITMKKLMKLVKDEPGAVERYTDSYGDLKLPLTLDGSARENASAKAKALRLAAEQEAEVMLMAA